MPSEGKRTFTDMPSEGKTAIPSERKRTFSEATSDSKPSDAKAPASDTKIRHICLLCKRKFQDEEHLVRHAQLSEVHRRNLAMVEEQVARVKYHCRGQVGGLRQRLTEVERTLEAAESALPDNDKLNQRNELAKQIRTLEDQYGSAQEQLEKFRVINTKGLGKRRHVRNPSQTVAGYMISCGVSSWQGGKEVQEDRYSIHVELEGPGGEFMVAYGVFDGHSGSLCADFLVQHTPANLQKCISSKTELTKASIHEALQECFQLTDDDFLEQAKEAQRFDGSTAIVAVFWPGAGNSFKVTVANCGDCRAVLARGDGGACPKAVPLSEDHKPNRPDEQKRIALAGGVVQDTGKVARCMASGYLNFGGRNIYWGLAVSRSIGDLPLKEPAFFGCMKGKDIVCAAPDIETFELFNGDVQIVMCCDGIFDVFSNEDVIELAGGATGTEAAARQVVRAAYEKGSEDNLTAVVIRWQKDSK